MLREVIMKVFKRFKIIAFVITLVLITGCGINISCENTQDSESFNKFLDDIFVEDMTQNGLDCHYMVTNPDAYGISAEAPCLGDLSRNARSQTKSLLKNRQKQLHKFDYSKLSKSDQLDYDILDDWLKTRIELCDYDLYFEPLSPSNGLQSDIPMLFCEYKFRKTSDVEDYLTLLTQIDTYFDGLIELETDKADSGLFMPDFVCDRVISQCRDYATDGLTLLLIDSFDNKLIEGIANGTLELNTEQMKTYIKENRAIVSEQVIPAYSKLADSLSDISNEVYKSNTANNSNSANDSNSANNSNSASNSDTANNSDTASNSDTEFGICRLPKGRKYYELLVYASTRCSDSIEVIDKRISDSRITALSNCKELVSEDSSIINKSNNGTLPYGENESEMLEALKHCIENDFPALPDVTCSINKVDPYLAESMAPAFYITAPIDDYKDNTVYINSASNYDQIHFFTTLAHESIPGHLYQTTKSYDYGIKPYRSTLDFGGYVEGWATYVELMSYNYAGLENNTAQMLMNNQIATLSLYASSDIGINYYGWNMSELKNFWSDYGIVDDKALEDIMTLIVADPGNYLKYYVGYLEFEQLKKDAINLEKENFNLKTFHEKILRIGPAPFDIIRKYLN